MKIKVSISMGEEIMKEVEDKVINSVFRNKSHFIELATKKYLREVKKWKL